MERQLYTHKQLKGIFGHSQGPDRHQERSVAVKSSQTTVKMIVFQDFQSQLTSDFDPVYHQKEGD